MKIQTRIDVIYAKIAQKTSRQLFEYIQWRGPVCKPGQNETKNRPAGWLEWVRNMLLLREQFVTVSANFLL